MLLTKLAKTVTNILKLHTFRFPYDIGDIRHHHRCDRLVHKIFLSLIDCSNVGDLRLVTSFGCWQQTIFRIYHILKILQFLRIDLKFCRSVRRCTPPGVNIEWSRVVHILYHKLQYKTCLFQWCHVEPLIHGLFFG